MEHSVRLYESSETYLELIQATAAYIGIPAVHVEKDYWITRVLKRLHESEHNEAVVLKGGTSLSKAHRLIERFSEDIDLALKREEGRSDSQCRKLIRSIERGIACDLHYLPDHPGESKHGRFRKTAHAFPMQTDATALGQVSDALLLEINSFANPEPALTMQIGTLIRDFLVATGRTDLVRLHELDRFSIDVLSVERTLCEKIMSLVRTGHLANPAQEFRRRVRHFYDLVMIMRVDSYREFVATDAFADLIIKVRESDQHYMPGADQWLSPPLSEATIVAEAESLWGQVRSEFRGSFRDMVYGGSIPDDSEVLECLGWIGTSLIRI